MLMVNDLERRHETETITVLNLIQRMDKGIIILILKNARFSGKGRQLLHYENS